MPPADRPAARSPVLKRAGLRVPGVDVLLGLFWIGGPEGREGLLHDFFGADGGRAQMSGVDLTTPVGKAAGLVSSPGTEGESLVHCNVALVGLLSLWYAAVSWAWVWEWNAASRALPGRGLPLVTIFRPFVEHVWGSVFCCESGCIFIQFYINKSLISR